MYKELLKNHLEVDETIEHNPIRCYNRSELFLFDRETHVQDVHPRIIGHGD